MSIQDIMKTLDYGPAPESDAEAMAWLDQAGRTFPLFINGKFCAAQSGATFASVNPATLEDLGQISAAGDQDVDAAVAAARKAQQGWAALKGTHRAKYLYALARHLQKHQRLFAVLESLDNGKTIREARDIDVPLAIRHFYYHAGWAALQESELPDHAPLGVAGQIIPWNFPLLMLAWKIAPAIAMGNTVVLKPAEQTSLTALLFAQICQEVDLPPGVVNIVTGDGATGAAIVAHPGIDKIAFTGSTEVGRIIRKATAGTGKALTLELGGKSPFIVFADADLEAAAEGVVDSIWFNQGQVCCAGSRLLVEESIADAFNARLRARMATLRLGNPLEKNIDMGPIVSKEQLTRITGLVDAACRDGAERVQAPCALPATGFFYPPTLLTGVEASHSIAQEEIFGPVLVSMTFRTPDEAVNIANHSRFGLAASVWSENLNLSLDLAAKLQAGVVWINSANQFDAAAGFGGVKESGFGREGGKEGLFAYLKPVAKTRKPAPLTAVVKITAAPVDRTAKHFIGGKQARPDSGYSMPVRAHDGTLIGHVGQGNRKDIRNAVEAARTRPQWTAMSAHGRAQVLFYLAENLAARRVDFAHRIAVATRRSGEDEVDEAIDTLIRYAGWCDKYDGAVRTAPVAGAVLQFNEPVGVIGILCEDSRPLAGLIDLVAPALAAGNRVVVVPSQAAPLPATDFYQVMETSDLPPGALNIVTGSRSELAATLAAHNDLDALWCAEDSLRAQIEALSAGNLKRTWTVPNVHLPMRESLAQATQTKSVWIPYGE